MAKHKVALSAIEAGNQSNFSRNWMHVYNGINEEINGSDPSGVKMYSGDRSFAGGVFVFATGFFEDAVTGIAGNLVLACWRKAEVIGPDNFEPVDCPYSCYYEINDNKNGMA